MRVRVDASSSSGASSPWAAVCLGCRTAFERVSACDEEPAHRVVDLMSREGQEALLGEVWHGPETLGPLGDLRPRGASDLCVPPARPGILRGVVEGRVAPSPLGRQRCVAYALALVTNRPAVARQDVVWREAATVGFFVRLDDGAQVVVQAGRLRFDVDRQRAYYAPRAQVAEYLPAGLGIRIAGEPDFIPFDRALEDVLRPADRVELVGTVEVHEDRRTPRAWRRDPVPTVLMPVGIPLIRRLD